MKSKTTKNYIHQITSIIALNAQKIWRKSYFALHCTICWKLQRSCCLWFSKMFVHHLPKLVHRKPAHPILRFTWSSSRTVQLKVMCEQFEVSSKNIKWRLTNFLAIICFVICLCVFTFVWLKSYHIVLSVRLLGVFKVYYFKTTYTHE